MNARALRLWASSLPVTVILMLAVLLSCGEVVHSRLLNAGEAIWSHYYVLRNGDAIRAPGCNPDIDLDAAVRAELARRQAAAAKDSMDTLLDTPPDAGDIRISLQHAQTQCRSQWANYRLVRSRMTPAIRVYSTVEKALAGAVSFAGRYNRMLLCLLLVIGGATATARGEHFAIRGVQTRLDNLVSTAAQVAANILLVISALAFRAADLQAVRSGVPSTFFALHAVWIGGFSVMTLLALWRCLSPSPALIPGGRWRDALLSVPLYVGLCFISAAYFFSRGFYAGISVYTDTMMELTTMLLNLALYVWVGMLLKQTRLADRVFDVLRPWQLTPELLALAVLVLSAVLTAYTGASGAYVMAAGGTIYYELCRAGARKPFALAVSAMSGSLGVVLAPCLLVVIIAAIDGSVTTDELFASGFKVFVGTTALFLVAALLSQRTPLHAASPRQAIPVMNRALWALLPDVLVAAATVLVFRLLLGRGLDAFSAPVLLPIVLLAIMATEVVRDRRRPMGVGPTPSPALSYAASPRPALRSRLRAAAEDSTVNLGGLLMLVALSVSFGGIIERSGVLDALPMHLGSPWLAMSVLVPMLIFVGMFMDPYGAIILVNSAFVHLAVVNGISALHFWALALVSFELGYLTPPVALNHLLARAVIGDREADAVGDGEHHWWRRYEHYLLPITVMLLALLLIAYLPLAWPGLNHWLFQRVAPPH